MDRNRSITFYYTGGKVSLCRCGWNAGTEPKDIDTQLRIYTDGRRRFAHCPICNTTWKSRDAEWVKIEREEL